MQHLGYVGLSAKLQDLGNVCYVVSLFVVGCPKALRITYGRYRVPPRYSPRYPQDPREKLT